MTKRLLCSLLCVALLALSLPMTAFAAEFNSTELDAALEEAAGYAKDDYTEETWTPFASALEAAEDLAMLLSPVPEDDYVKNGSFESGSSDIPNDWVSDEGAQLKQGWNPAHTGSFIVSRVWTAEAWYNLPYGGTQTVTLPQAGVYRISGWINGTVTPRADCYFAVEDEAGNKVLNAPVLEGVGESGQWNEHAAEGFLEAGTYVVHFYIHANGMPQTDDVSLKMVAWPGYDELTQTTIDDTVEALNDAMDGLVRVPTNKEALQAEIARAEGLDELDYTPNTWVNVAPKLTAAKTVDGDSEARQSEIDAATADLKAVLDVLVKRANITALSEAITAAEALQKSEYMPSTWYAMQVVLAPAKAVLADGNATQKAVDDAEAALTAGVEALIQKPGKPIQLPPLTVVDTATAGLTAGVDALSGNPDEPISPIPPVGYLGDVNGDDAINSVDARLVLQYTVDPTTLTEEQVTYADYNQDDKVDSKDAREILARTVS